LKARVAEIQRGVADGGAVITINTLNFLKSWLVNHSGQRQKHRQHPNANGVV
jgi:hypothetical protein